MSEEKSESSKSAPICLTLDYDVLENNLKELDENSLLLYENLLSSMDLYKNCINDWKLIELNRISFVITANFVNFQNNGAVLNSIVKILHYTIDKSDECHDKMSIECFQLMETLQKLAKENDENGEMIFLQFVYTILTSLRITNQHEATYSLKERLVNFLIDGILMENKLIFVKSLSCLLILIKKFHDKSILESIWGRILKTSRMERKLEILCQLIDENQNVLHFVLCAKEFYALMEQALTSSNAGVKRQAIFIMKKGVSCIQKEICLHRDKIVSKYFRDAATKLDFNKDWLLFFTIYENLQEKQSHLILPSLELLPQLNVNFVWKDLLIKEILQHKNKLVLKWIVLYGLNNFNLLTIDDAVLGNFLSALNYIFLYADEKAITVENYGCFIKTDLKKYFQHMVKLTKSVPVHFAYNVLMKTFVKNRSASEDINDAIDYYTLMKLSYNIRQVQNTDFRKSIEEMFASLFFDYMKQLTIEEFTNIRENLSADWYNDEKRKKMFPLNSISLQELKDMNISLRSIRALKLIPLFNMANISYFLGLNPFLGDFIDILEDNENNLELKKLIMLEILKLYLIIEDTQRNLENIEILLGSKLAETNLDKSKRFICYFLGLYCTGDVRFFEQLFESILKNRLFIGLQLHGVFNINLLKERLLEKLLDKVSDLPLHGLISIENIGNLIEIGDFGTFKRCVMGLPIKEPKLPPDFHFHSFFDLLIKNIRRYSSDLENDHEDKTISLCLTIFRFVNFTQPGYLFEFVRSIVDLNRSAERFTIIVSTALILLESMLLTLEYKKKYLLFLIDGATLGEPILGEHKIEYSYAYRYRLQHEDGFGGRRHYCSVNLLNILKQWERKDISSYQEIFNFVKDELFKRNEELNKINRRHFKNSSEHRLKLRLIQCLAVIYTDKPQGFWDDRFLNMLMEENNQNDVTYILEILVASTIERDEFLKILHQIHKYPARCHVSIFVVAYIFVRKHRDVDLAKNVINTLLSWTMGQNFHVRLYAQITIIKLIDAFKLHDTEYERFRSGIMKSFEVQGDSERNFQKLSYDFRYNHLDYENPLNINIFLYQIPKLNQVDEDELPKIGEPQKFHHPWITDDEVKETLEDISFTDIIQRKNNPTKISIDPQFVDVARAKDQALQENELIVVASLIDRIPNLGGIARTCEVLGIKNLVISSKKYTEFHEFKSLSMTAEKWLNIEEVKSDDLKSYLKQKQNEGYSIVGAEQTANSCNFVQFQFPKKSVLLLGHEKEGIPGSLLTYFDYTVEIPQSGMVRSLNVHVTGALFMWEFYKQHLSK